MVHFVSQGVQRSNRSTYCGLLENWASLYFRKEYNKLSFQIVGKLMTSSRHNDIKAFWYTLLVTVAVGVNVLSSALY